MDAMTYIPATRDHAGAIHSVLQTTIQTVYPQYYPPEVVDFFCALHSLDHVVEGIASGNVGVLVTGDGEVVGTGCCDGNHITGVYVLPRFQGRGCGSYIVERLEERIGETHLTACLDASLPGVLLYERRGYRTVGHGVIDLENGAKLVYERMEKRLPSCHVGGREFKSRTSRHETRGRGLYLPSAFSLSPHFCPTLGRI